MSHQAVVVEHKKLADASIAVRARCCNDPATDSWHTIYINENTSEADLDKECAEHCERVSKLHNASTFAEEYLGKKVAGGEKPPAP